MTENNIKKEKNSTRKDALRLSCYPQKKLFFEIMKEAEERGIKVSTYLLLILVDRHRTLSEQGYGHDSD